MNEYWPNLTCKPGSGDSCDTFWKHEFQKHGACAKSMDCLDTDTEYFENTVNFFKQLEVDRKTFNLLNYTWYLTFKTFEGLCC